MLKKPVSNLAYNTTNNEQQKQLYFIERNELELKQNTCCWGGEGEVLVAENRLRNKQTLEPNDDEVRRRHAHVLSAHHQTTMSEKPVCAFYPVATRVGVNFMESMKAFVC